MMETNPAWLDASFVQKILQDAEKDESIKVSDIVVKSAIAKGENYGSEMHRTVVKFSRIQDDHNIQTEKSLLVKVMPDGPMLREMVETLGFFSTECAMMAETLPRMNESLATLGFSPLSAQCLASQSRQPIYVVIEDLTPKGFRMAKRQVGLDLDHALLAIRNIARFHAASVALKEKDSNAFTKYMMGLFHKDRPPLMAAYTVGNGRALAAESATWSELSPRISEKLLKLSKVLYEKACEVALRNDDEFNVLTHGDCWVNNMMFRYDEHGKPIDHIFVDFQMSNYVSPAIDILYFTATSLTNDVRLRQRDVLLREYHASLTDTMVKLKCKTKPPSFDGLQESLKKRAFWEFFISLYVLAGALFEKDEDLQIEEMMRAGKEQTNLAYRGKSYREIMTKVLPLYDSMGLLDL